MSGLNKAQIIGRLGQDPDIRYTQDGAAVANISVATSEQWKDKDTGEKMEKTEWHRVVAFGKLAEIISQYLKKGSQVYIEGKLQTRKWQDKEGNDRYSTEIVANQMQMLGGRDDNPGADKRAESQAQAHSKPQQPQSQQDDFVDSDIPF